MGRRSGGVEEWRKKKRECSTWNIPGVSDWLGEWVARVEGEKVKSGEIGMFYVVALPWCPTLRHHSVRQARFLLRE